MTSVLLERGSEEELRVTAVSDLPLDPRSQDVPPVGAVIDERYEITGLLGEGGMGHVLSARHVVLGHRLAMKVLRREMTRDEEIVERFRREAKAASAIGHTGIVQVKDFGSLPNGASYFVMEHVDGKGLYDTLCEEGPFSVARAVDVVRQMADALGAAHAAGIIHRDVKPENVILASFHGRPDHVKILDFGIAKLDFASRLSGAHRVLGTPAYMSPEQTRGEVLDARSDVYSLGIVLYELLAGDPPFDHPLPLEVLRMQLQATAPSVASIRADVPEELADVIARCLEKSPAARPASMRALADLLAPFAGAPRAMSRPASLVSNAPAPAAPERAVIAESITLSQPALASAPPLAPARPTRSPAAIWLAAAALVGIGVVTLAAAGGLFARGHEVEVVPVVVPGAAVPGPSASASTPPVATALGAPAVTAAVASVPSTPDASALPSAEDRAPAASVGEPPPAHLRPRAHHAHGEPSPDVAPASAPAVVAPPAAPAHPTIRVIDPWDDP
ncbi:MAG: protein kinase [Sandaracinus sp.]